MVCTRNDFYFYLSLIIFVCIVLFSLIFGQYYYVMFGCISIHSKFNVSNVAESSPKLSNIRFQTYNSQTCLSLTLPDRSCTRLIVLCIYSKMHGQTCVSTKVNFWCISTALNILIINKQLWISLIIIKYFDDLPNIEFTMKNFNYWIFIFIHNIL